MSDNDKMREAFEKWYLMQPIAHKSHIVRISNGHYFGAHTETAWRAWQAAQSEQSVPVVGEVVAHQFYADGKWHNFIDARHYQNTVAAGYEVRALVVQPTTSITAAELATLREKAAEADELRKDAERYRWLRDPSVYVGKVIDKVAGYEPMTELGTGGYPIYEYRAGPELDVAIDAAIAQGKGE